MPAGYQRHAAGPMRTSGTFIPPVDDLADSLLRARTQGMNSDPFTAEHNAAYHAFANVDDRKIARDLHRANVSWDDVNEYGKTGLSFTAYATMMNLMRNGVTPAVLSAWNATLPDVKHPDICAFGRAGLTPTQVAPYITPFNGAAPPVATVDHGQIPNLIAQGISATRVHHYQVCGVINPKHMLDLDRQGCRPAVLYAMRKTDSTYVYTTPTAAPRVSAPQFAKDYRLARHAGASADFCNAIFSFGGTLDTITAWHPTNAPAAIVGTLHAAGITPGEYIANPAIADDAESLAALAALRGHTVTAPTQATAMLAA